MFEQILAILGAVSVILTAIAQLAPKGSKVGAIAGKYGANIKEHLPPSKLGDGQ